METNFQPSKFYQDLKVGCLHGKKHSQKVRGKTMGKTHKQRSRRYSVQGYRSGEICSDMFKSLEFVGLSLLYITLPLHIVALLSLPGKVYSRCWERSAPPFLRP